jgi:enoyl-CoA hydratase/carnithine racemase
MGDFISGERAYQVGLVNQLVPRGEVFAKAMELARALAERPPHALKITKERMRELTQPQFDEFLVAVKKYQRRAYESGEPQRLMPELAQRMKKR